MKGLVILNVTFPVGFLFFFLLPFVGAVFGCFAKWLLPFLNEVFRQLRNASYRSILENKEKLQTKHNIFLLVFFS